MNKKTEKSLKELMEISKEIRLGLERLKQLIENEPKGEK